MKLSLRVALVLAAPLLLAATPSVTVTNAWSRATYGAGAAAVGYLVVTSHGGADRLTGAACTGAAATTIHRTDRGMNMGAMSMDHMEAIDSVPIPAGVTVAFQPGGLHLMLTGTAGPLRPGDIVPCTLHFATAGDVAVRLLVQHAGDTAYAP